MTHTHPLTTTACCLALGLLALTAPALRAGEPKEDLEGTVQAVLTILNTTTLGDQAKLDAVQAEARKRFDLQLMAKLVVGRDHWGKFSDTQKTAYYAAFEDLLMKSYSEQIDSYAGERITFGATRKPKADRAEVDTMLVSKVKEVPVVYHMRQEGDSWLVFDVVIDGVSIRQTYNNQYSSYLDKNSVDAFIALLQDKVNN